MKRTAEETLFPNVLRPYDTAEAMTTREAAEMAHRSESTIRIWCIDRGIGRRIIGVWAVSCIALQMLLEDDVVALALYHAGDRRSLEVNDHRGRAIANKEKAISNLAKLSKHANRAVVPFCP